MGEVGIKLEGDAVQRQLLNRDVGLDGLRALAALVVVAFHAWLPGVGGGFVGVDVFFVLSGFVITRKLRENIDRKGSIGLGRFWWERLSRLYPALLLMLTVFILIAPWLYPRANLVQEFWLSGLYLSDYAKGLFNLPDYTHHTWSLAVEMQFYLLWPLAVVVLHRFPRRAVSVLLVMFVLASIWRSGLYWADGLHRAYYPLDARMSGLILGSALTFVTWRPSSRLASLVAGAALSVLIACCVGLDFGQEAASTWGGVIVDMAAVALIMSLTVKQSSVTKIFSWAPLVRLGAWSYSIYLWHYPVSRLTRSAFDGYTSFAVTLVVSVVLAGLTFELFERPANRWLRGLRIPIRRVA